MGTLLREGRFCHDPISVVREPLPQTNSSIEPHLPDIEELVIWIAERAIRHWFPEPGFWSQIPVSENPVSRELAFGVPHFHTENSRFGAPPVGSDWS